MKKKSWFSLIFEDHRLLFVVEKWKGKEGGALHLGLEQ